MSVTTIRLQPETEQRLLHIAGTLQRSKSWLINQAVNEFIERQTVEQNRWQETLKAMESVVRGDIVSAEAVHAWLKSWGSNDELQPPSAVK